jgi:hypothetical protein
MQNTGVDTKALNNLKAGKKLNIFILKKYPSKKL